MEPFDLTQQTALITTRKSDTSGKRWDIGNETGLRYEKHVKNVEYFRDVQPIFERSCAACHTQKWEKPAGNLVLDDVAPMAVSNFGGGMFSAPAGKVPGTFFRLALDAQAKFGHKSPAGKGTWSMPQASRYVRFFQSRRSLLIWKVFGQRLDGWNNDDFAYEATPGDANSLVFNGKPIANTPETHQKVNLAFLGSAMPPPEAVAGTYTAPNGDKIKVAPLSDEDRVTLVRWIDLGCPIDLDFDANQPEARGHGWLADDNRPTLTLTTLRAEAGLTRLLVGMHDYDSGLDLDSFQVIADFPVAGVPAGQNLAAKFKRTSDGVWELNLPTPIDNLPRGRLTVSVRDRQGNVTRVERTLSVRKS